MAPGNGIQTSGSNIKAIEGSSVHQITSGQVVIDLQTAVKELVENSLDAGATNIEVRFKDYGLKSIEVVDNGTGIAPEDYDSIALKHHTSKLTSFEDLTTVTTFGFRGEALSSLCALSDSLTVTTATAQQSPMGTVIEMAPSGTIKSRSGKVARQRGTTICVSGLFTPLAVRRKEFERNAKREFGKALNLLSAYALVPCTHENKGVRLQVSNQPNGGRKTVQLKTDGSTSINASVTALWGPKSLENVVDLDLQFLVDMDRTVARRLKDSGEGDTEVKVKGLISSFAVGCGRTGTDRQFFFINGRPCSPSRVQKAFNEVYRSFNTNQSPFIVANFILPTNACDINVSPDKRTIFLHSENNLIQALKISLEEAFASSRSTFNVGSSSQKQSVLLTSSRTSSTKTDARSETVNENENGESDSDEQALPSQPPRGDPSPARVSYPNNTSSLGHQDNTPEHDSPATAPASRAGSPLFLPDPEEGPSQIEESQQRASADDRSGSPPAPEPDRERQAAEMKDRAAGSCMASAAPPRRGALSTEVVKAPPKQMVLTTTGASWNLRRRVNDEEGPPRKRSRHDVGEVHASNSNFRVRLRGFARTGSTVVDVDSEQETGPLADDQKDEDYEMREDIGDAAREDDAEMREDAHEHEDDESQGDDNMDVSESRSASKNSVPTAPDDAVMTVDVGRTLEVGADQGDDSIVAETTFDMDSTISQQVIDLTEDSPSQSISQEPMLDVQRSSKGSTAQPEIVRSLHAPHVSLHYNLPRVVSTWRHLHGKLAAESSQPAKPDISNTTANLVSNAGISNADDDEKASEALSRVIDKTDFASMEVLGQFNLGFIVVRQRKTLEGPAAYAMDDLFIIDQHAADEKYNFETLQQTTVIQSQKLLRPRPLEVTAADELLAFENLDVLKKNGFEINADGDAPPGQGRQLQLIAQPVSKGTVFDMRDLEELIHLMEDRPRGEMVRCSKARSMFASRACRKSVMVGMPLTRNQMATVVQHMGTMDQPWNCPHGRPTMRHLTDIAHYAAPSKSVNWAAFGSTST